MYKYTECFVQMEKDLLKEMGMDSTEEDDSDGDDEDDECLQVPDDVEEKDDIIQVREYMATPRAGGGGGVQK